MKLVRNPEGKRLLGRPRHRWKYNIKMGLRESRCEDGFNWLSIESKDELC